MCRWLQESECNDDLQKSECNDDKLDHLELLSIPLGSLDHTDPVINLDSVTNFFPHLDEVVGTLARVFSILISIVIIT